MIARAFPGLGRPLDDLDVAEFNESLELVSKYGPDR